MTNQRAPWRIPASCSSGVLASHLGHGEAHGGDGGEDHAQVLLFLAPLARCTLRQSWRAGGMHTKKGKEPESPFVRR